MYATNRYLKYAIPSLLIMGLEINIDIADGVIRFIHRSRPHREEFQDIGMAVTDSRKATTLYK